MEPQKEYNNNYRPLRIRAYLASPVVSNKYLPFDGLLYRHMVRLKLNGRQVLSRPRQSVIPENIEVKMPLLKRNRNEDHWYYAASFAQWPATARMGEKFTKAKRFDTYTAADYVDFGKKKAKVDTARGEFKNYYITEDAIAAPFVDWYVVGDKEILEKVLQFLTHVGKNGKIGCGEVAKWEITEWPEDWSKTRDGKLMRAIPSARQDKGVLFGVRGSYWNPKHQFLCIMPD